VALTSLTGMSIIFAALVVSPENSIIWVVFPVVLSLAGLGTIGISHIVVRQKSRRSKVVVSPTAGTQVVATTR